MIDTRVRAEDLFESLGREETQKSRAINLERSKSLEEMLTGFYKLIRFNGLIGSDDIYNACYLITPTKYTPTDIKNFIAVVKGFEKEAISPGHFSRNTGLYLSYLINNCKDMNNEFPFSLKHLDKLSSACYRNEKKLVIDAGNLASLGFQNEGDILLKCEVVSSIGTDMLRGKIHVYGNCGSAGTRMEGGEIIIDGDLIFYAGEDMAGGKIVINGKVNSKCLGIGARGGEIHVEGECDYESIQDRVAEYSSLNRVYHKGKLIIERGRKLV